MKWRWNNIKKLTVLIIAFILSITNYSNEKIINTNYILINKINLKQEFLSYKESSIDSGIIYLKESDFNNDFYILAAHSGNSNISYFKNIHKLDNGDEIILNINSKNVPFIVSEKYYVKKTGKIVLEKNIKNTLYLTTCDKYNKERQLIIKSVKKM